MRGLSENRRLLLSTATRPSRALALGLASCLMVLFLSSCTIVRLGGRTIFGKSERPIDLVQARMRMSYNLRRGTFRVARVHNSIHLAKVQTVMTLDGQRFSSADPACANKTAVKDALRLVIRSAIKNGPSWETEFEIRIHPNEGDPVIDGLFREGYGLAVSCRLVDGSTTAAKPQFSLVGNVVARRSTIPCHFAPSTTSSLFRLVAGNGNGGSDSCFYDLNKECAVHFLAQRISVGEGVQSWWGEKTFPVRLDFDGKSSIEFAEGF